MLKQLRQRWKNFVRRHIVCWPEEFNPHAPQYPLADTFSLRMSVSRFYRLNPKGVDYRISFDPQYDGAIKLLREDGWPVEINIDHTGEAYYLIREKGSRLLCTN
jgi:hypothetical protein